MIFLHHSIHLLLPKREIGAAHVISGNHHSSYQIRSLLMAVDLHTLIGDTTFSSKLDKDDNDDDVVHSVLGCDKNNNKKEDDFIAELTHRMAHFTLQEDDDTFDFDFTSSGSPTQNFDSAWDLTSSPQSSLWSHSPEGSSSSHSQEPSPPATPNNSRTYEMNLNERKNIEFRSHETLIQEQIGAIELSRLKQEQVLSGNVEKKCNGGRRRSRPPRPGPLQSQTGRGMRALFLGGRFGTGVFLPPPATETTSSTSSQSTSYYNNNNKQGKGCSVLIPARVVQALQLHFDKTAAMSAPKVVAFPPLRDLIVSGMDGMYSLENENHQTTKAPAEIQHDTILPREWTY